MLNKLIQQFNLQLVWEIDGAYVYNNENLLINFIELHSGTDWKYCLRADFPETFDRWSVALFEELFEINEFDEIVRKLEEFVNDKDDIVKEEMESHPELFDENYDKSIKLS